MDLDNVWRDVEDYGLENLKTETTQAGTDNKILYCLLGLTVLLLALTVGVALVCWHIFGF